MGMLTTMAGVSLCLLATAQAAAPAGKPHIVFLLIDDFGWADGSWHREKGYKEVQTENMQQLVDEGIELTRNYVFKFCSPTRSAIQSGRNPVHVNAQNVGMNSWDPANPFQGVSGIPVNMTGFAQRMAEAGYKHRVFAGKADFGMAYEKQSPMGRGYTDALFYFNHMNDYYSLNVGECTDAAAGNSRVFNRDLYGTNPDGSAGPQYHMLNPKRCWVQNMTGAEDPVAPFPKSMDGCACELIPLARARE
jgi:arylsulfatase A-like enzyme